MVLWTVPACVLARGESGIVKFHSRPRDAGGYVSWGFAGGFWECTRVRPRTRRRGIVKFHLRPRDAGGYVSWWYAGCSLECTRVRPRTRRKRNCKTPFTPAGRGRVRKLVICWWFSGQYPRASSHAEKGIGKFHSRPRDAGGYESWVFAGGSLDCTRVRPRTRRMRKWKIPFTPAGRGRVRKLGICWCFFRSEEHTSELQSRI